MATAMLTYIAGHAGHEHITGLEFTCVAREVDTRRRLYAQLVRHGYETRHDDRAIGGWLGYHCRPLTGSSSTPDVIIGWHAGESGGIFNVHRMSSMIYEDAGSTVPSP